MVPVDLARPTGRPLASKSKGPSLDKSLPPPPPAPPAAPNMTTVLVGSRQTSFKVNRKQLCAVSPFFRERLETSSHQKPISLWLPGESSAMFAIFVEWVHSPSEFRDILEEAIKEAQEAGDQASMDCHWTLIRLHLFASSLQLYHLQDIVMDAIQDVYLKLDWDVSPSLIIYLYTQCESEPAVRIRRWAVAMVAFTLSGPSQPLKLHPQDSASSDPAGFRALFESLPEFNQDYVAHMRSMKAAHLDVRFKNPQLRISANKLRNEQRLFGFRECSFHSHRAAVGQARCPDADTRGQSKHASELEAGIRSLLGIPVAPTAHEGHDADAVPLPLFSKDASDDENKTPTNVRSVPTMPKD
ncbi:hypothetical protein CDD81_2306 [Ophiocordyceps australis]|uniref:BTB domain-containing protein n=1 Tax=Ophiocordyceps australis TaxID=1399860 RepID=A0A2C5YCU0_9HYPO|nr:hypothetical protein CDD81_2306 [Ophiocordyceps australis]